ncbi:MAG TPA: hypothetical protein VLH85_00765 [Levilinea sp.]|nr:hypothetical protein [Levilinea sp.]
MLYSILLPLHNILRWLILITALCAILRALAGWLGKKEWTTTDDKAGMWFVLLMDIQLLVGLVLYIFLSPMTLSAFQNFAGAMQNTDMRFFAVEHILMMVIGTALAHAGRMLSRKASGSLSKQRRAAIWFGLALLVVLVAIPWPFSATARPWIRF